MNLATALPADGEIPALPEGWALTHIGEVCEINPAKPPSSALSADAPVTFVPMPAVDAVDGAITAPQTRAFAGVRKGFTSFRNNDVIMAKITPCMENGKAAIARNLTNGLGFGSTEFHVLRPTIAVLPEYVYSFIRQESYRRAAESEMTGSVGQKRVPESFLELTDFLLPPHAEQVRIVKKLTELLSAVTSARERLSRVPSIIKRFRNAVLAAACSGKLTEEWRECHKSRTSSDDLLRAILAKRAEVAKEYGIRVAGEPVEADQSQVSDVPKDWVITNVDQLSCMVTSGSRGWAKYYAESGPLFIRAQDINTDHLQSDGIAYVRPPKNAEGLRTRVRTGDLLITITGANVTKSALVDREIGEAYVSQHVALVRLVDSSVGPFLYLWTVSPLHGRAKLLEDAYGAGKPGLNLDNIREMTLALPSPDEQVEIVQRVNALFSLADDIERHVFEASRAADKLSQSLLSKAFGGELVPTEAELARREGRDYEPASVLLERIRAQKGNQENSPPVSKRKLRKASAHV